MNITTKPQSLGIYIDNHLKATYLVTTNDVLMECEDFTPEELLAVATAVKHLAETWQLKDSQ